MSHLENGSFLNSDNFDATDWNCWEIVQNPTVRECKSRCNSVENIHIHKVIGPWDQVIFVGETEATIREVPLVRSPKQVIVLIFIFLSFFGPYYFPSRAVSEVFSLFDTFSYLKKEMLSAVTIPQGQQHDPSAQQS